METTRPRRISTADTAKLLRAALKAEFPGVKFSVRSKRYAGGSSIRASYVDGPLVSDVQKVCWRYAGATFDGMEDIKNYHDSVLTTDSGAEVVSFGADFVHAERSESDAALAYARAQVDASIVRGVGVDPISEGENARYPIRVFPGDLALDRNDRRGWTREELTYQLARTIDYREVFR